MTQGAIGIFDSGVGGLTVYSEIRNRFPNEDLIYFGDTARVPYGPKSQNAIIDYSIQNARFLNSLHVKLIIIACNTSSAIALNELQKQFTIPIIGVLQPGAEKAAASTRNGIIGIIGTEGTVNSNAYPAAINKINSKIITYSAACPLFVPIVEEGWESHSITIEIIKEYITPLIQKNIDTLVLGCTHYPVLKKAISETIGDQITLIDSAETVADSLLHTITNNPTAKQGKDEFYISDNENKFRQIASRILNKDINNPIRVKLAESWFV